VIEHPELIGARRLMETFERHGFRPNKAWGQNFVIDPNTIRKVVDVSGVGLSNRVVEVGAGGGSLTLALAAACSWVYAIEYDDRLLPILRELLSGTPNVAIVHGDALTLDPNAFDATHVVGNLPYNIATAVVLRVLEQGSQIGDITAMTQREVGERLAATAGSKAYGLPSVMVRYHATARVVARVSRRAFYPVPNVDSVVVRIVRNDGTPSVDRKRYHTVAKAAFSQRRKTLRNALAGVAGSVAGAEAAIRDAGLQPNARAEEIDADGFEALARRLPQGG
jgi:16S rRNA (adenine1518-N6/adenine1519-N6)-dimethyltransferase